MGRGPNVSTIAARTMATAVRETASGDPVSVATMSSGATANR